MLPTPVLTQARACAPRYPRFTTVFAVLFFLACFYHVRRNLPTEHAYVSVDPTLHRAADLAPISAVQEQPLSDAASRDERPDKEPVEVTVEKVPVAPDDVAGRQDDSKPEVEPQEKSLPDPAEKNVDPQPGSDGHGANDPTEKQDDSSPVSEVTIPNPAEKQEEQSSDNADLDPTDKQDETESEERTADTTEKQDGDASLAGPETEPTEKTLEVDDDPKSDELAGTTEKQESPNPGPADDGPADVSEKKEGAPEGRSAVDGNETIDNSEKQEDDVKLGAVDGDSVDRTDRQEESAPTGPETPVTEGGVGTSEKQDKSANSDALPIDNEKVVNTEEKDGDAEKGASDDITASGKRDSSDESELDDTEKQNEDADEDVTRIDEGESRNTTERVEEDVDPAAKVETRTGSDPEQPAVDPTKSKSELPAGDYNLERRLSEKEEGPDPVIAPSSVGGDYALPH